MDQAALIHLTFGLNVGGGFLLPMQRPESDAEARKYFWPPVLMAEGPKAESRRVRKSGSPHYDKVPVLPNFNYVGRDFTHQTR